MFSLVLKWCFLLHYKLQGKRSYVRIKGLIHGKWSQVSKGFMVQCGLFGGLVNHWEFWKSLLVCLGLGDSTYYFVRAVEKRGFQVHLWEPWEELCLWTISFWSFVQLLFWKNLVQMGWLYEVNFLFVNNHMTNWL
jgi:hypothetical protein